MSKQEEAAVQQANKQKVPDDALIIYFFDSSTLKAIEIQDDAEVSLRWRGIFHEPRKLKLHKAGKESFIPVKYLIEVLPDEETAVEIRLANTFEYNCQTYESTPVSILVSKKDPLRCRHIPVPLTLMEETCALKVTAYDCGSVDFIENAKFFLDNVEVRVTSMKTGMPSHDAAARFQSVNRSGRTRNGEVEFLQLPKHQMYRIEVRGPDGYICDSGSEHYRYVCCSSFERITVHLRPCGQNPERTVIFVREECTGVRWNGNVDVAGHVEKVKENGILPLDRGLKGLLELKAPGTSFTPPVVDARDGAPVVALVKVAEQALLPARSSKKRFRFEDEHGAPFCRRPVVISHRGKKETVITDDDGFFEAEEGAIAHAEPHEFCPAVEPLLLLSVNE